MRCSSKHKDHSPAATSVLQEVQLVSGEEVLGPHRRRILVRHKHHSGLAEEAQKKSLDGLWLVPVLAVARVKRR